MIFEMIKTTQHITVQGKTTVETRLVDKLVPDLVDVIARCKTKIYPHK